MGLELKGIRKAFGKKVIFNDFNFTFEDKGIYAITGKSGSGKTTLLRIIAGLDKNFSGDIIGGGLKDTSVCFQEHRLFPTLSAFDNVFKVAFKEETESNKNKAQRLLTRLNFSESDMLLLPNELSGGMRQRIAFARAVLKDSKILILDEATKELDASLTEEMLNIIKEEAKKRTVIIVTHNESEIEKLNAKKIDILTS